MIGVIEPFRKTQKRFGQTAEERARYGLMAGRPVRRTQTGDEQHRPNVDDYLINPTYPAKAKF